MSYYIMNRGKEFGPRKGLEGPFHYPNGAVLYYDAKEGQYYNPRSDFYLDDDEVADLKDLILDIIRR